MEQVSAGFRQVDTRVRRMGDFGDYFFDGSWKASSFANPPEYYYNWTCLIGFKKKKILSTMILNDSVWNYTTHIRYLDAQIQTPWTRTLNFKPVCGLSGPPSLWPIEQVQSTPAVPQKPIFEDCLSRRGNNIPGYKGYIPGEKAETVYGSLRSATNDHCEQIRQYEQKNSDTQGAMPVYLS